MTVEQALEAVRSLSAHERVEVMHALIEDLSLERGAQALTPEQKAELIRRRDAHRSDPSRGIPLESLAAEMRERYQR